MMLGRWCPTFTYIFWQGADLSGHRDKPRPVKQGSSNSASYAMLMAGTSLTRKKTLCKKDLVAKNIKNAEDIIELTNGQFFNNRLSYVGFGITFECQ